MSKAYFATDGSYGSADDLVVLDVSNWTEDDWRDVDDAGDNDRIDVARRINRRHTLRLINADILWHGETSSESVVFGVIPDDFDHETESTDDLPKDDEVFYWLESEEASSLNAGYDPVGDWVVVAVD